MAAESVLGDTKELTIDEWLVDLISATCLSGHGTTRRDLSDRRPARNAERIEFARQQLVHQFAEQHRLSTLA